MGSELDLDELLSIVQKMNDGSSNCMTWYEAIEMQDDCNRCAAIIAAVNAIEPLIDRCRRAEDALLAQIEISVKQTALELKLAAQVATLILQREELLAALRFVEDYSIRIDQPSLTRQVRIALKDGTDGS